MIKSKKQMYLVIGAFALVLMLGTVTYAFFNYTRTGSANTIRTGRIAFNSEQGTAINLANVFPIDVTNGIPNNNANVGSVTINVTGDTTYTDGIEYLVSAVNVQNAVGSGANAKTLPISIDVSVSNNTGNDPATTLGSADSSYFTNRGPSASTSIYKVLAKETISNNDELLVGYIKSGSTGIDGNIVIKAYIDASKVAISDTYNEITPETDQYGTTSNWVGDRVVFTTSEWNSLQANGISFQVKVESNEGTWVEEPAAPVSQDAIPSCPGCKFVFTGNTYYYSASNIESEPLSTMSTFTTNGDTLVDDYTTLNVDHFLGFTFDGSGNITKAYACGINANNNDAAFCLEGVLEEQYGGSSAAIASVFAANVGVLNTAFPGCDASTSDSSVECSDSVYGHANSDGGVNVFDLSDYTCYVHSYGSANCDS